MSLYDGLGIDSKEKSGQREQKSDLTGWSSGIKLLQTQLQLKKAALTQAKRDQSRKGGTTLAPVFDLKSRVKDEILDDMPPPPGGFGGSGGGMGGVIISRGEVVKSVTLGSSSGTSLLGGDWDVRLEYDPLWPNDYEKILRERKEKKERDREEDKRRDAEERESHRSSRRRERHERNREMEMRARGDDEEGMERERPRRAPNSGVAIAPPPSLAETIDKRDPSGPPTFTGSVPVIGGSVAARIMAKYGFKEGQGLGKQEQGMSQALQVEKTSKRGGKIIHERDLPKDLSLSVVESPPPSPPPQTLSSTSSSLPLPSNSQDGANLLPPLTPLAPLVPLSSMDSTSQSPPAQNNSSSTESITTILRNPSKIVLLRNMVGPGEVDEDLEPETKEECGKYGEVSRCLIFEIPGGNIPDEDAVRIFIEFKRVESAIKAVVDLNGRYFGGRIVKAGFYEVDKFKNLELLE